MNCIVFTGPTLPASVARTILPAVYMPPVAQGDVYRAVGAGPAVIAIIDGYFERQPAVWHKELLWAMKQGIHVFGAASMGALRAAELEAFGMNGIGVIFEAFRDRRLEDDDEVAVAHADRSLDYRPLSDAMVNIRQTLSKATEAGVIGKAIEETIVARTKEIFYPERRLAAIPALCRQWGVSAPDAAALARWLPANTIDQKRLDAESMLRAVRDRLTREPRPHRAIFSFQHTEMWEHLLQTGGGVLEVAGDEAQNISSQDVLDEARLAATDWPEMIRAALLHYLTRRIIELKQVKLESESLEPAIQRFRRERGLLSKEQFADWLQANDLSRERFISLVQIDQHLNVLREGTAPELIGDLLDLLRIRGTYRDLKRRAVDKSRILSNNSWSDLIAENVGLSDTDLLAWFSETRRGGEPPADPEAFSRSNGFKTYAEFKLALLREYLTATSE